MVFGLIGFSERYKSPDPIKGITVRGETVLRARPSDTRQKKEKKRKKNDSSDSPLHYLVIDCWGVSYGIFIIICNYYLFKE